MSRKEQPLTKKSGEPTLYGYSCGYLWRKDAFDLSLNDSKTCWDLHGPHQIWMIFPRNAYDIAKAYLLYGAKNYGNLSIQQISPTSAFYRIVL